MSVPLPLEKQRKGRGFRGEEEPVVEETENWETLDQAEGEGAIGGGWKRCKAECLNTYTELAANDMPNQQQSKDGL